MKKSSHVAVRKLSSLLLSICCIIVFVIASITSQAQTNPTAQNLTYSQNFGTTTFTVMPTGTVAWTVTSSPKGSQSSAESSTPNGDATITAATTTQTTGGCYGYATSSNGRLYVQASSNSTNGTNQLATAIVTSNLQNIQVSYDVEMISAQAKTIGVVLQYRVGTSGSWTTVSGSAYAHNNSDRSAGQVDNFANLSLPAGANDNAVVQLRWATWRGSESGNSSGIGIDNISISGSAIPTSYYFRSKQTGNWNSTSSWEMSTDNSTWANATFTPNYKCKTITVQTGHQITLTASDTVDQLVVNGILTYGDYSGSVLTIHNETGVDLTINGTFEDFGPSSITWLSGSTWEMGSNGTLIRTRSTSSNYWRDHYNSGISNIPATSNWIVRKTSTDSPTLSTTSDMSYPNLYIENSTGTTWTTGTYSSFTGFLSNPVIKGSLYIGGNGSGNVSFLNENTNSSPALVEGSLIIKSGSTLRNYGTGFEVQGNLTVNGTITYDSDDARKIIMSGGTSQSISGSGTINIYDFIINKSANNISLSKTITIDHLLTLTSGNIVLGTNDLILGTTATISGGSSSSYINTNGTGKISKKYAATGTAFTFPTGDGSYYTPYTLTLNSATLGSNSFISVRVINSTEPHVTSYADHATRYWDVSTNDITNLNIAISYSYVNNDITGSENKFVTTRWNAANGLKRIGVVNTATNTAGATGITEVGNFTVAGICSVVAEAGADVTITAGDSVQIGSNSVSGYTYSWSPLTGLSDANMANPWAMPEISRYYYLTVTNSYGCFNTDSIFITTLGTSCVNAKKIILDTSCNQQTFRFAEGQTEYWFKFTASKNNCSITLTNPESNMFQDIFEMGLFKNECDNLSQLGNIINNDSILIYYDSLLIGNNYYIEISRSTTAKLDFNLCIKSYQILTQTISPCNVTSCLGPELIRNGDFSNQPPYNTFPFGFYTAYVYGLPYTYGRAGVISPSNCNLHTANTSWYSTDHTSGNCSSGGILAVDGNTNTSISPIVWEETITGLTAGNYYYFTFWVNNVDKCSQCSGHNHPEIALKVNNSQMSFDNVSPPSTSTVADIQYNSSASAWVQLCYTYHSNSTSVILDIYTNSTAPTGNDFALDDISFKEEISLSNFIINTSTNPLCLGQNSTLSTSLTGSYSYSWSNGLGNSPTVTVSPTVTTTYTVTVIDNNNNTCSGIASIVISPININSTINSSSPSICIGQSSTLTAAPAGTGYTYQWSPSTGLNSTTISDPVASPLTTTTYTVIITDANGCTGTASITINVSTNPVSAVISATSTSVLCGNNTTITASGGSTYNWSSSPYDISLSGQQNNAQIIVHPITTTTYTVTVSNGSCSETNNMSINVSPNFNVSITGNTSISCGQNTTLTAIPSSGSYTYQWYPSTGLSNTSIYNPIATPNQNTSYTVTVTDVNGCSGTASITISVNAGFNIGIWSSSTSICAGQSSVNLQANIFDPQPWCQHSLIWSSSPYDPSLAGQTNNSSITVTPITSTTYFLVASAYPCYNCSTNATITITVNPVPTVTVSSAATECCYIGTVQLNSNPSGGTPFPSSPYYNYQWAPNPLYPSNTVQNPLGQPLTSPVTIYTVTITDANGCTASADIPPITVYHPSVNIVANHNPICSGNSSALTANAIPSSCTYQWNTASLLQSISVSPSVATSYTVTVSDTYGCKASDDILISVNPTPIADAGPDVTICAGQSTTLAASGGATTTCYYFWNPGTGTSQQNIIVNPISTTIYTVTVVNMYGGVGCQSSDQVTVTVIPTPESNFAITNYCQTQVTFDDLSISNDPSNLTYTWDFGDGCTITGIGSNPIISSGSSPTWGTYANPIHEYLTPRYYLISLTVSFGSTCSAFSQQTIYAVPSNLSYNTDCCSEDPSLYTNGVPSSFTVSASDSWSSGSGNNPWNTTSVNQVYIHNELIIQTGVNLVINGMTFCFSPSGKVIIQPGATLTMNGTIFKGIKSCNNMWQGVEVWGNSSYRHFLPVIGLPGSHNPVPDAYGQSKQGKLIMNNSASIQDAHIGVLLGRTNICIPNPYTPFSLCKKIPYLPNYCGGILNADHSRFVRCGVAVKILPFHPSSGSGYVNYNASKIVYCSILGGDLPDPGYSIGNPYLYEYPTTNTYLPLFANANSYSPKGHAVTGIYLYDVRYVTIINDEFGSTNTNKLIEGIKSFDSPYNVSKSLFQNLDYGIRIFNTSSSLYGHTIYDNNNLNPLDINGFYNIANYSVQAEGSKFDNIQFNTFGNPNISTLSGIAGILLNNTSRFNINDNNFNYLNLGINCFNSLSGGGNIASRTQDVGNVFTECPLDINTYGSNPKLQIHCNTSDNTNLTNKSNWENSGPFTNQGIKDNTVEAQGPAGNAFYPSLIDSKKVINNNYYLISMWPVPIIQYVPYRYFRHGGTAYPERIPAPFTATPSPTHDHSLQWIIDNTSSPYHPATSCIPCLSSLCNTAKFITDSMKIDSLQYEYNTLLENLDAGITQQLIDSIADTVYSLSFKNLLINSSPLSDTVLLALIDHYRPQYAKSFKDIIILNSPVSDIVLHFLEDILDSMATTAKDYAVMIRNAQANTYLNRTLTAVSIELNGYINDYQLNLNNYIQSLISNDSLGTDSIEKAINILERQNNNETRQLLICTYLANSNFTVTQDKLNSFIPQNQEETDWKNLTAILINNVVSKKTVFDISDSEKTVIANLANDNSCSPASINAQAILRLVYGEEFDICPISPNNEKTNNIANNITANNNEKYFLGDNIPNPFNNTTRITYKLPEKWKSASLNIYDITGKKIKTFPLTSGEGVVDLLMDNYQQGVYLYNLIIDGYAAQTKRMVLVK